MGALDQIVRSGKALYVGISNYRPERARQAIRMLREMGTPCLIHQPRYNLFDRWIEEGLTQVLREEQVGCICFSPLAGGLLTDRYLHGIPADSRAGHDPRYLKPEFITEEKVQKAARLNAIAARRGQKLSQMALQWVLRDKVVTSALIGASRPQQILDNVQALRGPALTAEDMQEIETILAENK